MADIVATHVTAQTIYGIAKSSSKALKSRSPKKALEEGRQSLAAGIDQIKSYKEYYTDQALKEELMNDYRKSQIRGDELESKIKTATKIPIARQIAMNKIFSEDGKPFLRLSTEFQAKAVRTSRDLFAYYTSQETGPTLTTEVSAATVNSQFASENPFESGDDTATLDLNVSIDTTQAADDTEPPLPNDTEGDNIGDAAPTFSDIELNDLSLHLAHAVRRPAGYGAIASSLISGISELTDSQCS